MQAVFVEARIPQLQPWGVSKYSKKQKEQGCINMENRYNPQEKIALNITEAAEMLGISRNTMYRDLLHRQDFPAFKIGGRVLIPRSKLEAWAKSQPKNL